RLSAHHRDLYDRLTGVLPNPSGGCHMVRLVAVSLLAALMLVAQTNRGGISGNVTDPSGAVVPNATVVIVNEGTNETHKLTTSAQGTFIQENLDPVTYKIEITAAGFKKSVLEHVKVDTSSVVTANVTLSTGDVATEVTVTAGAEMINTESGA